MQVIQPRYITDFVRNAQNSELSISFIHFAALKSALDSSIRSISSVVESENFESGSLDEILKEKNLKVVDVCAGAGTGIYLSNKENPALWDDYFLYVSPENLVAIDSSPDLLKYNIAGTKILGNVDSRLEVADGSSLVTTSFFGMRYVNKMESFLDNLIRITAEKGAIILADYTTHTAVAESKPINPTQIVSYLESKGLKAYCQILDDESINENGVDKRGSLVIISAYK
jgi:hypothetical protein